MVQDCAFIAQSMRKTGGKKEWLNMAFQLSSVVPWGRNMEEYKTMFLLNEEDMQKKIAGFGDGPASFNFEAHCLGYDITSYDPIYQFNKEQLEKRIEEVRAVVMKQMSENMDNYIWTKIGDLHELEQIRMAAMKLFLNDFGAGLSEQRYRYHELPNYVPVEDNYYDIGLSSHFLLLYTQLGYDFHIKAIHEMMRVCREVRIFPVVDLDASQTDMISNVICELKKTYNAELKETNYQFQKNANKMLVIRKE